MDGRAEHSHAEDIERCRGHPPPPMYTSQGSPNNAGGCGGHAVLARAGLGNDSLLPMRLANKACPMVLLILWAPTCGPNLLLQEDGPTDDAGQLGARRQWRGPTHADSAEVDQFRGNS